MPIRSFNCDKCLMPWRRYISAEQQTAPCPSCGSEISYLRIANTEISVTERVNGYWNKHLEVGLKDKLTQRSRDHMREHEMHDMIAKFGVDTLKNHPLMKDGRIRRKDE